MTCSVENDCCIKTSLAPMLEEKDAILEQSGSRDSRKARQDLVHHTISKGRWRGVYTDCLEIHSVHSDATRATAPSRPISSR